MSIMKRHLSLSWKSRCGWGRQEGLRPRMAALESGRRFLLVIRGVRFMDVQKSVF